MSSHQSSGHLDSAVVVVLFRSAEAGWACQAALGAAGFDVDAAIQLDDAAWEPDPAASPRERLIVFAAHPRDGEGALAMAATISPDHEIAVLLWWYGERPPRLGRLPSRGALECGSDLPPAALRAKVLHAVDRTRWIAGSRRAQTDAQRRGAQFDAVFRDSPDGLLEVAGTGRITRVNRAICEISGYAEHELLGQSVDLLVPDGVRDRHAGYREQFAQERQSRRMARGRQLSLQSKSGVLVPVEVGLIPLPFAEHRQTFCIIRDLREQLRLSDQLAALHAAVDSAAEATAIYQQLGHERTLIYANRAMAALCGRSTDELQGANQRVEHHLGLSNAAVRELDASFAAGQSLTVNGARSSDGLRVQHLEVQLNPVHSATGSGHFLLSARDNTSTVQQLQRLTDLAARDPLTGLANRADFLVRLDHAVQEARQQSQRLAVAMVDIDRFRSINEARGHSAGDAILAWVGGQLQERLGPQWQLGRWGGDRFAAFGPDDGAGLAVADLLAMREGLQQTSPGPGMPQLRLSLGLAFFPGHAAFASDLVEFSAIAVQAAKRQGGKRLVAYDQSTGARLRREFHLQCAMSEALDRGEFSVVYQPQIDTRNGRLWGCEALLRWRSGAGESISPAEFIPVAERAGLITEIGEFVTLTALDQLRTWRAEGLLVPHVSVNVSAHCLVDSQLSRRIAELAKGEPQLFGDLRLEITESTAVDPVHVPALMEIAELGMALALDDFGTGHSSLSALRHLPLTELKLDRSFLSQLPGHTQDAAIVRSVIELAHHLGLVVVAEGVETEAQARWLRSNGCDALQGYHYAPGLPPEQFAAWCGDRLC